MGRGRLWRRGGGAALFPRAAVEAFRHARARCSPRCCRRRRPATRPSPAAARRGSPAGSQAAWRPARQTSPACSIRREAAGQTARKAAISRPKGPPRCTWRGRRQFPLEHPMPVPKRKTSRMKQGFRRSHDALEQPTYVEDKEFRRASPSAPHRPEVRQISRPRGASAEGIAASEAGVAGPAATPAFSLMPCARQPPAA